MTRLQWIILVGLTAISVVTAIALGTVFAKQKELSDHNYGAPECCTCKEMKDTATGAGSSLDEFFERNPSLGRNDCEDDACAKGLWYLYDHSHHGDSNQIGCHDQTVDIHQGRYSFEHHENDVNK
ncbi:hypothetical protein PG995_010841 [Apiospora arundinis]